MVYFILRPPGRAPRYFVTLDRLAVHVRTAQEHITMGRLADKYRQVNNAVAAFELQAERDVDGVLDRVRELHQKRETVTHRHHTRIDEHMTDLSEFAADLDEELSRGNGGPLVGSDDGEKPAPPVGTETTKAAAVGDAYVGTNPLKSG